MGEQTAMTKPDRTAVEILEEWLEAAREGRITAVAMVADRPIPGMLFTASIGAASCRMIGALSVLQHKLTEIAHEEGGPCDA